MGRKNIQTTSQRKHICTQSEKRKNIRVYQVRHIHRRKSRGKAIFPQVNKPSLRDKCTNKQNNINYAESSVVQWESGKSPHVPAQRKQKLTASRVRSLSSTPVVMSAAFIDLLHTTKEKEGTSNANCWKLKEKKEASHEPNNYVR